MSVPFREFAATLHEWPGVASCCIDWQDRLGADVMVVLFCCWRAARGRATDAALLQEAIVCTQTIERHLLRPLRAARRAVRQPGARAALGSAAGDALLARELEVEWLKAAALDHLDAESPHDAGGVASRADVAPDLARYLGLIGVDSRLALRESAQLVAILRGFAVGA